MNGQNTGKCEGTEKHMNLTGYKISHQDDNIAIILWNTINNYSQRGYKATTVLNRLNNHKNT